MIINNKYKNIKCKICDSSTTIFGVCDFNKNCVNTDKLKLIGYPIYYHICNNCNFIFTTDLDSWSIKEYKEYIYNDEYILVDPSYEYDRPHSLVSWFMPLLEQNFKKSDLILDYGAGTSVFGNELSSLGWNCSSWDPVWELPLIFNNKFDLITAFEVLEHTPTPIKTTEEILSLLSSNGKILIQTLCNDSSLEEGINCWYISPRNGHVSMHSTKSLSIMFSKYNKKVKHLSLNTHIVY